MSHRSYDSIAHQKRLSKFLVTDDDLFEYVLKFSFHILGPDQRVSIDMFSVYRKHQTSHLHSLTDIMSLQPPELSHTTEALKYSPD
jgi:hypothetical protein